MTDGRMDAVEAGSRAIVVFSGDTELSLLRFLRPGFRHCYIVVEAGRYWIFVDPSSNGTGLAIFQDLTISEMASWFLSQGSTVVCCRAKAMLRRKLPIRPQTCVESIKQILSLRAPFVLTPWQLFQYLSR